MKIKQICCIGAGYVGGPTMAVIAKKCPDIQINLIDINEVRIKEWNSIDFNKIPIYEPGLSTILKECRGKNLHFSTKFEENIRNADLIFISVNTPTKESGIGAGKAIDLKWIEESTRTIAKYAFGKTIVVEKSTLPVRTAQTIKQILETSLKNSKDDKEFHVLSNPEFLAEGTAINDLLNPDRILIGGENKESIDALKSIYLNWVTNEKIITTNLWSSELSKLIANAFLAQKISSINSISALCERTGADISEVALAVGADRRIGQYFLNAGPGFGGSCFKKDILNLIYICEYYGLHEVASYWEKVITINNWQKKRISSIILEKLFGTISGKKIGILGFSFKANTNDTRESPAIDICHELMDEGAKLSIYDPKVNAKRITQDLNIKEQRNLEVVDSVNKAAKDSDALVILTEWEEFKNIDWGEISKLLRKPSWVFDTRRISNLSDAKKSGINIWIVGHTENF